jgi:hypothetical protein
LFNKKKQRPMTSHETLLDFFIKAGKSDVGNYPGTYSVMPEFSSDPMKKLSPPFSLGIGGEFGADQGGAGVGLSGTGRWGSGLAKKGLDFEAMLAALEKHESAGPGGFKSLGKPGGAGKAGGFNLFSPSMVEGRTPPGPIDPDEQRKRWWEAYARSIA